MCVKKNSPSGETINWGTPLFPDSTKLWHGLHDLKWGMWSFSMRAHMGDLSFQSDPKDCCSLQRIWLGEISGLVQSLTHNGHQSMWWPNSIILNLALESIVPLRHMTRQKKNQTSNLSETTLFLPRHFLKCFTLLLPRHFLKCLTLCGTKLARLYLLLMCSVSSSLRFFHRVWIHQHQCGWALAQCTATH